jgi:hypothetical protein
MLALFFFEQSHIYTHENFTVNRSNDVSTGLDARPPKKLQRRGGCLLPIFGIAVPKIVSVEKQSIIHSLRKLVTKITGETI